jgi:hypothetical protein
MRGRRLAVSEAVYPHLGERDKRPRELKSLVFERK